MNIFLIFKFYILIFIFLYRLFPIKKSDTENVLKIIYEIWHLSLRGSTYDIVSKRSFIPFVLETIKNFSNLLLYSIQAIGRTFNIDIVVLALTLMENWKKSLNYSY